MTRRMAQAAWLGMCFGWASIATWTGWGQDGSVFTEPPRLEATQQLPSVLRRRDTRPDTAPFPDNRSSPGMQSVNDPSEQESLDVSVDAEVPVVPLAPRATGGLGGTGRTGSATVAAVDKLAVRGQSPAVRVDLSGPPHLAVGKTARFQLLALNEGSAAARDVTVTVTIPNGVELGRTTASSGDVQPATDGHLRWRLPVLTAGERATLTLELTPQQDAPIAIQYDWLVRATANATIAVVRPMLHVAIQGPEEVLYGTRQLYTITVSNRGTGPAEDVTLDVSSGGAGQAKKLGVIPAGGQQQVRLELVARDAGQLVIRAVASGDGVQHETTHTVVVRRAELAVTAQGPEIAYAGATVQYRVQIANVGNAAAPEVDVSLRLPDGAKYLGGIEGASESGGRLQWKIRNVAPANQRTYFVDVRLEKPGDLPCEVQAAIPGELASVATCTTRVEALADLKLEINDPQGPKAVGDEVVYEIRVRNRGLKAANHVKVLGQFSKGIEPIRADGAPAELVPGQVLFAPLSNIPAGQTVTLRIIAQAEAPGTHRFRATLQASEPAVELIAEDATTFYPKVAGQSTPNPR